MYINNKEKRALKYRVDQNVRQNKWIMDILKKSLELDSVFDFQDYEVALGSAEYEFTMQKKFINRIVKKLNDPIKAISVQLERDFIKTYVSDFIDLYNEFTQILEKSYKSIPGHLKHLSKKVQDIISEEDKIFWCDVLEINYIQTTTDSQ